jgi:cell division protein FtsB
LLLVGGSVFLGRAVLTSFREARISKSEYEVALREVERVRERANTLRASVGRLATDAGFEEEVRERLNVTRPGEQVVVIVPDEPAVGAVIERTGFWQRILGWLGLR